MRTKPCVLNTLVSLLPMEIAPDKPRSGARQLSHHRDDDANRSSRTGGIAFRSASLAAASAEDWAAVVGGGADAQLQKRLEASVRTIPGTDTRFLVGGFVELDGLATRNKQTGPEQDTFLVSATPFGPADSDQRLSIRQSQLNWLSATPTELGTITTDAQVNLFSLDFDGKTKLSLWHLYAQLADVFVAGKTYSTFVDPDVLPTTLDFNGPSGSMAVQQWLARGIVPLGAGWTLAGSIEQSQADHRAGRRAIRDSHERAPARSRRASALRLRARARAALRESRAGST